MFAVGKWSLGLWCEQQRRSIGRRTSAAARTLGSGVRDLEGLTITALQCVAPPRAMWRIVYVTKACTSKHAYWSYMLLLLGHYPSIGVQTAGLFYLSRRLNTVLKHLVRQPRPYNEYPHMILYFKKRKRSLSFPSQSVQSLWIIRDAVGRMPTRHALPMLVYFTAVLAGVCLTRMYRGLHYPHDFLFSLLLAQALCTCRAFLCEEEVL